MNNLFQHLTIANGLNVFGQKNLVIDMHLLQTVPPNCMNRDDTGSPKTCIVGGTTRLRLSSQSLKRPAREIFNKQLSEKQIGYRTRNAVEMIVQTVMENDPSADRDLITKKTLAAFKLLGFNMKDDKDTDETEEKKKKDTADKEETAKSKKEKLKAAVMLSQNSVDKFAKAIQTLDIRLDSKGKLDSKVMSGPHKAEVINELRDILRRDISPDIALGGRMVANDVMMNVDAAVSVSHAITTHAVRTEFDVFTAMDDYPLEGEAGAAHLDVQEFGAGTFYRLVSIDVNQFIRNYPCPTEDAVKLIELYLMSHILTLPHGKEHAFAHSSLPEVVYLTVRRDKCLTLSNAFERGIRKSSEGYMQASEKQMLEYAGQLYKQYNCDPEHAWCSSLNTGLTVEAMMKELETALFEDLK